MLTDHIQTRVAVVLEVKCAGCGTMASQHDLSAAAFAKTLKQYGWEERGEEPQAFCNSCAWDREEIEG